MINKNNAKEHKIFSHNLTKWEPLGLYSILIK